MKDIIEMHVSLERKERLAKQGIALLKSLNKVYKHYRLAVHAPTDRTSVQAIIPVQEETSKTPAELIPATHDTSTA